MHLLRYVPSGYQHQNHNMNPQSKSFKFIKRVDATQYRANQTISIGADGGTDTIEDVPLPADTALEIELDDGSVFVVLGYVRK
jgi:hypothetical protein